MKKAIFVVGGMHCKSCNVLLHDVLIDIEGVKSVHADFESGTVKVEFEDSVSEDKLKEEIGEAGYEVEEVKYV